MARIKIYIIFAVAIAACIFLIIPAKSNAKPVRNFKPLHLIQKIKWVDSLTDCEILIALDSDVSNESWSYYIGRLEKSTGIKSLVSMGTFGYFYISADLKNSDCVEWHLKLGCAIAPYSKQTMDSIHAKRDFYIKKKQSNQIIIRK